MPRRVHFLNVRNGDCSIIQHGSGRVTMIDVSCAVAPIQAKSIKMSAYALNESWKPVGGNFNQKEDPDNPIDYLQKLGIGSIFRFILTHPDMDHLDGIKDVFSMFSVTNFWDTANTKEFPAGSFDKRRKLGEDWAFYKNIRDTNPASPNRLVYYSGNTNSYYKDDGLAILAPTKELVNMANILEDWNDASYVLLYHAEGRKILFCGDSEDDTWEHISKNWKKSVSNVDVLIAPHHGRKSGRDYSFLNVVNPTLTLFGNASSEHLMYDACNKRSLFVLTNNMAGSIILDIDGKDLNVYIKNETYAKSFSQKNQIYTYFNSAIDGWYIGSLTKR